jgi:hypothetical protein
LRIIKHRVNSIKDIVPGGGLEIDVRDYNGEIVLAHDHPTRNSTKLIEFLKYVDHDMLLAINIKTTEIEKEMYEILNDNKIENYFTFDWAIPSLLKAMNQGLICAFRLSEYEKEINQKCSWVWVDAFEKIWYNEHFLSDLKDKGFMIALVSPELHNRKNELKKLKEIVKNEIVDVICTDLPEYWLND